MFKEYFTNYQSPSNMYKKLRETEGIRNEDRVYLIKQVLKKMKKKKKKKKRLEIYLKVNHIKLKKMKR